MRVEPVVVLLCCFFLFGALAELHNPTEHSVSLLRLYEEYEAEPPASVRSAMQQELDSIMAPIGWRIEWTRLSRAAVGELSISLAIIHFQGVCDVAGHAASREIGQTLGSTDVGEGHVLPFSAIDCDAVGSFVASELTAVRTRERPEMFGRALGRVLAHELYHVLTSEQSHGPAGIGKANLTTNELFAQKFRFAARDVQKLRMKLVPAVLSLEDPGASERSSISVFVGSGCAGCHGLRGEGTRWGPSLYEAERSYDTAKLKARLTNSRTEMYRLAKSMNVLWPHFSDTEVELLSDYLRYLENSHRFAGVRRASNR